MAFAGAPDSEPLHAAPMHVRQTTHVDARLSAAWAALHQVLDPEVPVLSVCDLGIVRDVLEDDDGIEVVLTPTYSGCPATEVITASVREALERVGLGPVRVSHRLAPAWTSDWISAEGRRKLRDYGIAPPHFSAGQGAAQAAVPIGIRSRLAVQCPRCESFHTERLSAFGSTACKALHRCLDCREPFEHFKPI